MSACQKPPFLLAVLFFNVEKAFGSHLAGSVQHTQHGSNAEQLYNAQDDAASSLTLRILYSCTSAPALEGNDDDAQQEDAEAELLCYDIWSMIYTFGSICMYKCCQLCPSSYNSSTLYTLRPICLQEGCQKSLLCKLLLSCKSALVHNSMMLNIEAGKCQQQSL